MKKTILILLISWISFQMNAQNSIGIQVGILGTHTSVAEYERIERFDNLLDSVDLSPDVASVQAAINVDIDLGKNFFLSTGFHYSKKGLANVVFTDSTGWPWQTPARQHYMGMSMLIGYHFHFRHSKFGLQVAAGPQADFAIGTPNGGALFSGPYYRFFMPFCRFNEVDLGVRAEVGASYKLGPGDVVVKLSYLYGMSDVLEDAFIVARSMSYGISLGYSLRLSK
ncbi:MAG: outer membrane beta-barrel protein [Bacteroidetes bacterium]|nr:outer membrane beta-barrel protein [Bacteroidota bacterium]